ncbi:MULTISPECIES: hypothetical protein [Stenotrophomonas]|uniref:hypothetical protein n=1 Tax=Stenotrophomonas TaxID=40323 RepID=UPI0022EAEDB1|nr:MULTISPECIES: hypothetical protein [Stenotrophomonas]MDA3306655.1 hypothetical protein [Stenotrophomonas sp. PI_27]WGS57777.1 hypothetical protein IAI57_03150 [Stenotrophomonas pavanii]
MPCPYPSIALLRGRHHITALLFCLCCAGCIADRASAPDIKHLSEEAASSPEVQDLTRHYRSALERAMAQEGVLEGFSCGLSICIGLVRSGSLAGHETWSRRFALDAAAPTYSYADASEDSRMGYENRFIFSTDPALRAISGN